MVLLKGVDELVKDFILSLFARLDIRVHLGVVALTDVININCAAGIFIHNLESFATETLSEVVHDAADTTKELLVVDSARAISVEDLEKLGRLSRLEANTEIVNSLLELLRTETATAIIISNLERAAETHNTTVTTLSELFTEALHKLSLCHVHSRCRVFISSLAGTTTHAHGSGSTTTSSTATTSRCTTGSSFAVVFGLPALLLVSVHRAIHVPCVVHHQGKVLIVVDGSRDVVIVLNPLILADDVIGSILVAHRVGSLESLEELRKDLLFGLLAGHNIRVHVGFVDTTDIIDINHARAIFIHNVESFQSDCLATSGHGTTDGAKELVVLDQT